MSTSMAHHAALKIADLPDEAYLKLDTVLSLFGISKPAWYEGIKTGIYPRQVRIGKRSARWVVGEIRATLTNFKANRKAL